MAGKSNKRRNRRVNSSESVEVPANPAGNDDNLEQVPVTQANQGEKIGDFSGVIYQFQFICLEGI